MARPAPITRYTGEAPTDWHENATNKRVKRDVLAILDDMVQPGLYGELTLTLTLENGILKPEIAVTRRTVHRVP